MVYSCMYLIMMEWIFIFVSLPNFFSYSVTSVKIYCSLRLITLKLCYLIIYVRSMLKFIMAYADRLLCNVCHYILNKLKVTVSSLSVSVKIILVFLELLLLSDDWIIYLCLNALQYLWKHWTNALKMYASLTLCSTIARFVSL